MPYGPYPLPPGCRPRQAQRLVAGARAQLIAGVNLPMLLRTVCYLHEPLDVLVQRALSGGSQGVMQVACENDLPLSS